MTVLPTRFNFRVWKISEKKMIDCVTYLNPTLEWGKDYILMQAIGLKDKDEQEIYEGDILITNKEGRYGFVKYYKNYALYLVQYEHSAQFFNLLPERQYFKVIGNIYENPELLEKRSN